MDTNQFLNNLKETFPDRWISIQETYNNMIKSFGEIVYVIIENFTIETLSQIFNPNLIYSADSEVSIIKVVMQSGVHQELVFRFCHSFLSTLRFKGCQYSFKDWYFKNDFSKEELSTRISFPSIPYEYDKNEAYEKGVEIEMVNPPKLTLSPYLGVSQWTHGSLLITTFKRCFASIELTIKVKILTQPDMLKALCIGVYDNNNRVVATGRIWQWIENVSDFEIPVIFECKLEELTQRIYRIYFFWEGTKKNYSYLNRLAYRQEL